MKMLKKNPEKRYSIKKCFQHEAISHLKKERDDFDISNKLILEIDKPEYSTFTIFKDEEKYSKIFLEMISNEVG